MSGISQRKAAMRAYLAACEPWNRRHTEARFGDGGASAAAAIDTATDNQTASIDRHRERTTEQVHLSTTVATCNMSPSRDDEGRSTRDDILPQNDEDGRNNAMDEGGVNTALALNVLAKGASDA